MSEENKQDQPIEGHVYDGISELDNPLPSWWLATFFITIVFSFIYFLHIHLTPNNTIEDEYQQDVVDVQKKAAKATVSLDTGALSTAASSPEQVAQGQTKFMALCASCHGNVGQGGIGPNLTDKYWLHGQGTLEDIVKVVQTGVVEKGMPAWSQVLKPQEVVQVTAFVKTLQGTTPSGAKAPQGTEIQ